MSQRTVSASFALEDNKSPRLLKAQAVPWTTQFKRAFSNVQMLSVLWYECWWVLEMQQHQWGSCGHSLYNCLFAWQGLLIQPKLTPEWTGSAFQVPGLQAYTTSAHELPWQNRLYHFKIGHSKDWGTDGLNPNIKYGSGYMLNIKMYFSRPAMLQVTWGTTVRAHLAHLYSQNPGIHLPSLLHGWTYDHTTLCSFCVVSKTWFLCGALAVIKDTHQIVF